MTEVPGNTPVTEMQQLMTEIAKALVDEPESVAVETFQDGETTVLSLSVSSNDIGKLIGKQGRTARSLRTILGAASMKHHHRFALDIVEAGADADPEAEDDNRGNR